MADKKRFKEVEDLAKNLGLDFFPVVHEVIERSTMFNICAYGLPTRARHWSYGRSYDHQKAHGEMGLSKVYEVILNNDPSYAFMLDTNTDVQNLFIVAHCAGHCFAPGTLVETIKGPKKIEEIDKYDKVLTHTGSYKKPNGISKRQYVGKLIRLKIGSFEILCTPEHPFLVVKHQECSLSHRSSTCKNNCKYHKQDRCDLKPYKNYQTEWIKAKDLTEKDFVVFPKTDLINSEQIEDFQITGHKGKGHPGGIKNVCYDLKVDEKFGEFLGLYLAEGYSRGSGQMGLCFHTNENFLHESSRHLINELFGLDIYEDVDNDTHSHQILFNEKVLANWLRSNCGPKSHKKMIPDFLFKSNNKKFSIGLLRGLFHGDGHNGSRVLELTTTSSMLATQIRHICLKYNIKTNIKIREAEGRRKAYIVTISGSSRNKFANFTNISWDVQQGNREFEFCWFDDRYVYTPISQVGEIFGETEVYNLDVPDDSSYVLYCGATTHNSDFFKNNCMFKGSNRSMIRHAAEHAERIEEYINKYGLEKVEHIMDIGFALDGHIDWHKGLYRKPYGKKETVYKKVKRGEFDDVIYKRPKPSVIKRINNEKFPPHKEQDLLWFFINYAPLEEWERDVLDIIREEHFYFYPQMMTKIMNEGWSCVTPESLVFCPNKGLIRSGDVVENKLPNILDGSNTTQNITDYFCSRKKCKSIRTKHGYKLAGALQHKLSVWENGERKWKSIGELKHGDSVEIRYGQNCWNNDYQQINFSINPKKHGRFSSDIKIPEIVDEQFAKFLGYFSSEGHIGKRCVCITNGEKKVVDDIVSCIKSTFGICIDPRRDGSRWRVEIYSTQIIELLKHIGADGYSKKKKVPSLIINSPKTVVVSYLSSLFTGDGGVYDEYILALSSSSLDMIDDVRMLLLNLGIVTHTSLSKKEGYEDNYRLVICNQTYGSIFANTINTSSEKRKHGLIKWAKHKKIFGSKDIICLNKREYKELLDIIKTSSQKHLRSIGINYYFINNNHISKEQVHRISKYYKLSNSITEKMNANYIIDKINFISDAFMSPVVDFTVENSHTYQAQGFVNHNSYWHAEIMYQYKGLKPSEYIDFLRDHEKVVQPGGNPFSINPYFLGYKIFKDIERRWDEKYGEGAGRKKIFEVREVEDDISFLRNYLTTDLVEELKLFTYGYAQNYPKDHKGERLIEIKERMRDEVVETLVKSLYNGGVPKIFITDIGPEGKLIMEHESIEVAALDHKFASKTLEYVWDLWAAPIELYSKDDDSNDVVLCFDEAGYYEKRIDDDLDFDDSEEEEDEDLFRKSYRGRIIIP